MAKVTIEEYARIDGGLGVVPFTKTNVTSTSEAVNTNCQASTRAVHVTAEDGAVRVAVGEGATADSNSVLIAAGSSRSFALPQTIAGGVTYRVSVIDAA